MTAMTTNLICQRCKRMVPVKDLPLWKGEHPRPVCLWCHEADPHFKPTPYAQGRRKPHDLTPETPKPRRRITFN